jgi:hypothetical protein
MRLQFNTGYVTNSSSTVHFYDKKQIEENPAAMGYVRMLGLDEDGYLGATYLSRGQGDAILWADWVVDSAREAAEGDDYGQPLPAGDIVAVMISDEMSTTAEIFVRWMESLGIHAISTEEYH